jgi:gluconolactonase
VQQNASPESFDLKLEVYDKRFGEWVVGGSRLERLFTGMQVGEGPVYFADLDFLLWTDIPGNRIFRYVEGLGIAVFRSPCGYANGNTRDREGRLVTCEHGGRRVVRTEPNGALTILAERYAGKRLNSPNDVIVKSDGSIWFTDPDYDLRDNDQSIAGPREIATCNVYRVDPGSGAVSIAADDCVMPNGLAFSLDETKLYVSDASRVVTPTGTHSIRVYDVAQGSRLTGGRVFTEIEPGVSDGFRLDSEGFLWTTAGDGVQCFSPDADLLGRILIPEPTTNLVFGGSRGDRLFVTGLSSLWSVSVRRTGAERP